MVTRCWKYDLDLVRQIVSNKIFKTVRRRRNDIPVQPSGRERS